MDSKPSTALARRLAAYSATAGIALAVAPEAGAQVVYHDFVPDIDLEGTMPPGSLDLDLDDDGVYDIQLFACGQEGGYPFECNYYDNNTRIIVSRAGRYYFFHYRFDLRVPEGGNVLNGVLGYRALSYSSGLLSRLGTGVVIGPPGKGQGFYAHGIAASSEEKYGSAGAWLGQAGYAGFRFVAGDGQLHYGWLRLSITDNANAGTAYEYAYEATPDTPILAGAVSDALLDGAIDQNTFPASGGTLRYTFTVENITTEPLPLDLWVHYSWGGGAGRVRRLGSGTLPPLARVTRTVRVDVPAGAPAGAYDVRFRLGEFATRRFITFERYEVVKEGAAAGASREAFAVEPAEGDLFAEVGAASALPGTHALSAPSPNPTTGRAEVLLQVAEAQTVRVEVLDALGRRVAVLHDGVLAAGEAHRLVFDGMGLPSGVYVVRAVGAAFSDTRVVSLAR